MSQYIHKDFRYLIQISSDLQYLQRYFNWISSVNFSNRYPSMSRDVIDIFFKLCLTGRAAVSMPHSRSDCGPSPSPDTICWLSVSQAAAGHTATRLSVAVNVFPGRLTTRAPDSERPGPQDTHAPDSEQPAPQASGQSLPSQWTRIWPRATSSGTLVGAI
jgi:hypothetical protein